MAWTALSSVSPRLAQAAGAQQTQNQSSQAAKRGIDLKFADAQQKRENQIKRCVRSSLRMWTLSLSRPS
jgi:hypothetical protein